MGEMTAQPDMSKTTITVDRLKIWLIIHLPLFNQLSEGLFIGLVGARKFERLNHAPINHSSGLFILLGIGRIIIDAFAVTLLAIFPDDLLPWL